MKRITELPALGTLGAMILALGLFVGFIGGIFVNDNDTSSETDCKIAAQNFTNGVYELGVSDSRFETVVKDFIDACEIEDPSK